MSQSLYLGLLFFTLCGLASCAPAAPQPPPRFFASPPPQSVEESAARSERSTNQTHIAGTSRKIQMFIKNRHLQILPDGTVNGTTDDSSAYTILQRTTVGIGQMKIQGVGTCQYLCMDGCGLLYGSRDFGDECVFNEMIEHHHYNTYSSRKYSNERRALYLALNRRGHPRKVLLRAKQPLGRLSSYTRVLTRTVPPERAEEFHPMRHHGGHMCPPSPPTEATPRATGVSGAGEADTTSRCRRRNKKKKKKRKCLEVGSDDESACQKRQTVTNGRKPPLNNRLNSNSNNNNNNNNRKCESDDSEECQRVEVTIKKKPNKTKYSDKQLGRIKKKKNPKGIKSNSKKLKFSAKTTTEAPVTATDDVTSDEDYVIDSTTSWDLDDSTAMPLPDEPFNPLPD